MDIKYIKSADIEVFPSANRDAKYIAAKRMSEENVTSRRISDNPDNANYCFETDGDIDDVIEVYALIDGMAPKKLGAGNDFELSGDGLTISGAGVSGTIEAEKVVTVTGLDMYAGMTATKTYTVADGE